MIEWLTTIPGILVLCGILLLIIAIILFIVGAKKSKSEAVINTNPIADNSMNTMNDNLNTLNNQVNVPNVVPVIDEPVVSDVVTTVDVSQSEPVNIVSGVDTSPVVDTANLSSQEVVNTEPVVQEQPIDVVSVPTIDESQVYGGEAPIVDFTVQEEKPVTIYGGNDPLEATQTFPAMEENHVPYGGNFSEIKTVEPIVDMGAPEVSEETVEMPVIEPVVANEDVVTVPEVQNIVDPVEVEPEIQITEPVVENQFITEPIVPNPVEVPVVEMPVIEPVTESQDVVSIPEVQNVESGSINEPEVVSIPTNDVEVNSGVEEL